MEQPVTSSESVRSPQGKLCSIEMAGPGRVEEEGKLLKGDESGEGHGKQPQIEGKDLLA